MNRGRHPRSAAPLPPRRAFTLIELIAVMVVLAVLSGIAIPRYFDYRERAMESADKAAIGSIESMFAEAYTMHRALKSPTNEWITSVEQIPQYMEAEGLPTGIGIDSGDLIDQRGYRYRLSPETLAEPARLTVVEGSGPDDPGGGGGGGGGGSGGGGS